MTTQDGRYVCTQANPWRPGMPTPVLHPTARVIGNVSDGHNVDAELYECPWCGHRWEKELPQ